jgi:HEAT repeat protein
MKSPTWTERKKAFEDATDPAGAEKRTTSDADRLRLAVIQLLITENNDKIPAADERDGEENSEYYSSLIDEVAHLRDERAIPALLGAVMTGGMAIRGVAQFGEKALGPTLAQVNGRDFRQASGAVYVLQKMVEMRTANDNQSHLRIKKALRAAIGSPDSGVRQAAIFAIEYLDDREEFVPILKDLAERDSYKLAGQPSTDGTTADFYVVREHATKLLRKIANHEQPVIDQRVSD